MAGKIAKRLREIALGLSYILQTQHLDKDAKAAATRLRRDLERLIRRR